MALRPFFLNAICLFHSYHLFLMAEVRNASAGTVNVLLFRLQAICLEWGQCQAVGVLTRPISSKRCEPVLTSVRFHLNIRKCVFD